MIEKKTKLIPFDLERFEAGEYLKLQTRGGCRAVVTSVEPMNERRPPISGYLVEEHVDFYVCWQNGGVALCDGREHDNDLMMVVSSTPEPTPLNIPWWFVDKQLTRAAMNKNGDICYFADEPQYADEEWRSRSGRGIIVSVLEIDKTGIIPELSLTRRPD